MREIFGAGVWLAGLLLVPHASANEQLDNANLPSSYEAALQQAKAHLDPISWQVLENNQKLWAKKRLQLEDRLDSWLLDKKITSLEADEVRTDWVKLQSNFISDIKSNAPLKIKGGWSDGFTQVLLDLPERTSTTPVSARFISIGQDKEGQKVFCKLDGSVIQSADDLIFTPEKSPSHALTLRRLGVALSIENQSDAENSSSQLCPQDAQLVGQFFNIEGAELLFPYLLY